MSTSSAALLPIISLKAHPTPESLAGPLRAACTESGFFYLTDHGVSKETLSQVFALSKRYFLETSVEEKAKYGFKPESGLVSFSAGSAGTRLAAAS